MVHAKASRVGVLQRSLDLVRAEDGLSGARRVEVDNAQRALRGLVLKHLARATPPTRWSLIGSA
eukprot:6197803-Pleurochrysis_carterae.AAC.2